MSLLIMILSFSAFAESSIFYKELMKRGLEFYGPHPANPYTYIFYKILDGNGPKTLDKATVKFRSMYCEITKQNELAFRNVVFFYGVGGYDGPSSVTSIQGPVSPTTPFLNLIVKLDEFIAGPTHKNFLYKVFVRGNEVFRETKAEELLDEKAYFMKLNDEYCPMLQMDRSVPGIEKVQMAERSSQILPRQQSAVR